MAQKSIQVSAKKAKLKPAVKMSAKPVNKAAKPALKVKPTAPAKPMDKAMAIFEKAKSLIGKAPKLAAKPAAKPSVIAKPTKPTPSLIAAPVTSGKAASKANVGQRLEVAKAKSALVKETKVAAKAPEKIAEPTLNAAKPAKASKKGRKFSIDAGPNEAASALSAKWNSLFKKAEQIESMPYNMRQMFEEKTAIVHKVLGWGYILANRNDRLEVLFKDGIKYLISNYQP